MKMNNLEEISNTIKNAIQDHFTMTKIECSYTADLKFLNITIKYYCYDHDETLLFGLDDGAYTSIDDELIRELNNDIWNKITQKEAEYAAKRRSTGSN